MLEKHRALAQNASPIAGLAYAVVAIAFAYWARAIVIPVALAVLLTFVLNPAVVFLRRWHIGRIPAVVIVCMTALAITFAIAFVMSWQMTALIGELPDHQLTIRNKLTLLQDLLQWDGSGRLAALASDVQRAIQPAIENTFQPVPVEVVTQYPNWWSWAKAMFGPLVEGLARTALSIVLTVFLLLGKDDMRNRLLRLIGPARLTASTKAIDDAATRISRFLRTQLLLNAAFGLVLAIVLTVLQVKYSLLWGLFAAILRYIPYIGAWIGLFPPLLASLAMSDGWTQPLTVLATYAALELIINNAIEPRLFGHSLGVSDVAQIMSAAFWAFLWGPIGLVLSGPLTACLLVLGKYVPHCSFLEVILGSDRALPVDVTFYQRLAARDHDSAWQLASDFQRENPSAELDDQLLLPALRQTQEASANSELHENDTLAIIGQMREIADDLLPDRDETVPAEATADQIPIVMVPSAGPIDQFALELLERRLPPAMWNVRQIPEGALASEVIAAIQDCGVAAVVISAVSGRGFVHTRYLAKRLRAACPAIRLLTTQLGDQHDVAESRKTASGMGIDDLTVDLASTEKLLNAWRSVLITDRDAGAASDRTLDQTTAA